MAFNALTTAEIAVGKPVTNTLQTKIKDNFDDLDSRVSALSASANKIVVFEYNIDPRDLGIGEIRSADMSLVEFQSVHGTGWVLADGGSCTGSVYASVTGHSVVPDATNRVLRGDGTDAATLSTTQDDQLKDHSHRQQGTVGDSGSIYPQAVSSATGNPSTTYFYSNGGTTTSTLFTEVNTQNQANGGTETRVKSVTVNHFIKINLSAQDNILNLKAREDMTITNVKGYVIDNNGLGTSGNFEFDIKQGTSRAALSTIFTTKPILAYSGGLADGDATSSGTFITNGEDITAGDWLQLDITSLMPGQSGVYIQVSAEPA